TSCIGSQGDFAMLCAMAKVWICEIGEKSLSTKSVDSRPVKRLGLPIWTTDGRSSAPKTAFPANGQETTKAPKTRWLCFKRNLMARPESRASEQLQRDFRPIQTRNPKPTNFLLLGLEDLPLVPRVLA